jgi:hypothetical protein
MLSKSGFVEVKSHGETGYKSSPTTMGMLFSAVKPD